MNAPVSEMRVQALFDLPFMDLLYQAHTTHRAHHDPNEVQWSTLLSIKTGACPEDCGYCSQSAHHNAELEREPLLDLDEVMEAAKAAKAGGSTRFCMGAAWRRVPDSALPKLTSMIREVKAMGMETCVTLGTIREDQAQTLRSAGLDYYNHNLDTSREHYGNVVTTRTYDERLQTLQNVRSAGIQVCCGGILGLGESRTDRVGLLWQLANMNPPPDSVPINQLVAIEGTPMHDQGVEEVDPIEFVRTIAVARILMPNAYIRLSAGRETHSISHQALCFFAGANSIFAGGKLLTTSNPEMDADTMMFQQLGLTVAKTQPEPELKSVARSNCGKSQPTSC